MNKIFCLWCFVLNFENRERTQSPFSQVDWSNSRFSALDIYYKTFLFLFGWIQLNLTLSRDGLNLSIKIFLDSHLKDFFLQNSKKKLLRANFYLLSKHFLRAAKIKSKWWTCGVRKQTQGLFWDVPIGQQSLALLPTCKL